MAIASHMDEAGNRLRALRRRASRKPVDLPTLEERYEELEEIVETMVVEMPKLRRENETLRQENERLRRRVDELEGGRT